MTEADWRGWTPAHFDAYLDVVVEAFGVDRLMFGVGLAGVPSGW